MFLQQSRCIATPTTLVAPIQATAVGAKSVIFLVAISLGEAGLLVYRTVMSVSWGRGRGGLL